jgi:predicted RNase H-like HicB family nuclease
MERNDFISSSKDFISVGIHVLLYKENNTWVAFCPSLELFSYGNTKSNAKKAFHENIQIFIEETKRKGTLEKMLLKLGWTLRQTPKADYRPPKLEEKYKELIKQGASALEEQVFLPV